MCVCVCVCAKKTRHVCSVSDKTPGRNHNGVASVSNTKLGTITMHVSIPVFRNSMGEGYREGFIRLYVFTVF